MTNGKNKYLVSSVSLHYVFFLLIFGQFLFAADYPSGRGPGFAPTGPCVGFKKIGNFFQALRMPRKFRKFDHDRYIRLSEEWGAPKTEAAEHAVSEDLPDFHNPKLSAPTKKIEDKVAFLRALLKNNPGLEVIDEVLASASPHERRVLAKSLRWLDFQRNVSEYQVKLLFKNLYEIRNSKLLGGWLPHRLTAEAQRDYVRNLFEEKLASEGLYSALQSLDLDRLPNFPEKFWNFFEVHGKSTEAARTILFNLPMLQTVIPWYIPNVEWARGEVERDFKTNTPLNEYSSAFDERYGKLANRDNYWRTFRQAYGVVVLAQTIALIYQEYLDLEKEKDRAKRDFLEKIRLQTERVKGDSLKSFHERLVESLRARSGGHPDAKTQKLIDSLNKAYEEAKAAKPPSRRAYGAP